MYSVRVEAGFAAAHYLVNYHGKCENLHGHNYKAFLHLEGEELDEGGMLCDFGILKKALRSVAGTLDHTNLNDHPYFADGRPSAEKIARYIFEETEKLIAPLVPARVDVFETDTSRATYRR
ncbi:MAG: 6-carboxytetrahydropterin synthase QueD [Spirochaetales bacterium]|nr:6-carboxytetrahydropterin synthase QueD [Spirochaetales bacterium]